MGRAGRWPTIRKGTWPGGIRPNVVDYASARAGFSWNAARKDLDGLPGGRGLNIAHEAVDRHAAGPGRDRVAVRWLRRDGTVDEMTYGQLAAATNRFANALRGLGVGAGDRVFTLLGRVPELDVAVLGTLKNRSVACPLFSAFGPEPVRQRLDLGDGHVLVTTPTLYRRKVAPVRHLLPRLDHVVLVGADGPDGDVAGAVGYDAILASASDAFTIPATDPDDMALLHFTSGTTGTPKGAVHVHDAVVAHHATGSSALDLHPGDVFWCTADPGWVTGMSYGIIAPLTHGVTSIVDEADFEVDRWYRILADQQVSVWYTAPTALRMLMRAGAAAARGHDLSQLRFVASVGEPLNPEVVVWGRDALGLPVHDNWWQTETGGIMIANLAGCDIRPGSMGRPLPGVEVAILARGPDGRASVHDGRVEVIGQPGVEGELALRPGWPSMFRGYLHDEARYQASFAGGWYLTGDVARRDADGWLWFVGRADDVIKSAGHLIGPFEVESVLMEHPAVAEAGVIGVPDPVAGEVVKAFVTLGPGREPGDDLRLDLMAFARRRLGAAVAPRQIAFDQHLPKTKSGKILRRLLKARELGLPEGDLSTLEGDAVTSWGADGELSVDRGRGLHLLRELLRIRRFEERCVELYSTTKIRGFLHLYIGEEAVAVGVMDALAPDEAVVATYREHGHALARGIDPAAVMAEMFGKVEGTSRGRGGSMHLFDRRTRFYGGNAIVGGGLPVAAGLALADRLQHRERVTACFFGEGAVAEGEFHETMNLAALWRLPVLFCCENNLYAMGTALARSEAVTDLALRAASYGMPAWPVDGMDVLAVADAARQAAVVVRAGGGPVFLELRTYRFRAHSMYDPERYRSKDEVAAWRERDPIDLLAGRLRGADLLADDDLATIERDVAAEIDAAVATADAGTLEPVEDLTRFVTSETTEVAP